MKPNFLGRGASYPLEVSTVGGIRESAGARKIEESIRIILGTQYGERVMRPTFGCNLKSLAFAPINDTTVNLARHYVEEGLARWEPRIEDVSVLVTPENRDGLLLIEVQYRIKATQEVRSLVYPFYLEKP